MTALRIRGALGAGIGLLLACSSPPLFLCSDDDECEQDGEAGTCQPGGLCSFPDDDCATGQKYGNHAGNVSGECVPNVDQATSTGTTGPASSSSSTGAGPMGDTTVAIGTGDSSSSGPAGDASSSSGASTDTTAGTDSGGVASGVYEPCGPMGPCPSGNDCVAFDNGNLCLPKCVDDAGMELPCPGHPEGYPVACLAAIAMFDYCVVLCEMDSCPGMLTCNMDPMNPGLGICVP